MMIQMEVVSQNALDVLAFTTVGRERWPLRHAISTRQGGVSSGVYQSLNVGFRPGDDPTNVIENRRRLCVAIGTPTDRFVSASLSHLANVRIVDAETPFGGFGKPGAGAPNVDALVTDCDRVTLFVTSADCSLTLLFDPVHAVLAVIHAGWQSAALNIHANVVRTMRLRFNSEPAQLFAGIGPLVSSNFYSVPRSRIDVLKVFYGHDLASHWYHERAGQYFLDIRALLTHQLLALGVVNIETSPLSTDTRTDLLFSARREGETGRFALIASLDRSFTGAPNG
jgi:YfiH family protein